MHIEEALLFYGGCLLIFVSAPVGELLPVFVLSGMMLLIKN
jgi:hypothetical protein